MKIYIDYDTTLVNLIDPWVKWINEKYNVNLSTLDINRWYYLGEVFGREADDFWRHPKYNHYIDKDVLQPYEGAVEFFKTLQKKFGEENVFIISSTKDHHKEDKIKHAMHFFGIQKQRFIPVNKEKYHITKDGILIDDYPLHVMEHIAYNEQKGIVFNYEGRFGWCRQCNYELDKTLDKYKSLVENEMFLVKSSFEEIIEEINDARIY